MIPWNFQFDTLPSLPRLATNLPPRDRRLTSKPSKENVPIKRADTPVPPQEDTESIPPPLTGFLYGIPAKPLVARVDSPVARTKQVYYEDVFACRSAHNSPQERVVRSSVVVAELKTNVKSKIEGSRLACDLAFRLAQVYQRPESNIMVSTQQDACIFFDASLPSYLLKIYALPSLIAPMTNMRNTDLIQGAICDLIRIPADHGVVLYFPIPEDNLGTNGTTARGEISRLERTDQADSPGIFKTLSRTMSRRLKSSSGNSAPMSPPSSGVSETTAGLPAPAAPAAPAVPVEAPSPADWANDERGRRLSHLGRRESLRSMVRRRLHEALAANKDREDQLKGDWPKDGPAEDPK